MEHGLHAINTLDIIKSALIKQNYLLTCSTDFRCTKYFCPSKLRSKLAFACFLRQMICHPFFVWNLWWPWQNSHQVTGLVKERIWMRLTKLLMVCMQKVDREDFPPSGTKPYSIIKCLLLKVPQVSLLLLTLVLQPSRSLIPSTVCPSSPSQCYTVGRQFSDPENNW